MSKKKTTASALEEDAHKEELKESVRCLRLTVTKIQQLGIAASPENYAIWYTYYSGGKPELKQALDRRLNNKQPFTPQVCRQFYSEYFVEGPEQQLAQVRRAIRTLISKLTAEISELDDGLNSYEVFLGECETELAKDPEVRNLNVMIQDLLSQTKSCRSQNSQAMQKVGKLNKEVAVLQHSLRQMSEEVLEDALTGVANQRGFDKELERSIEECATDNSQLILVMLDLDDYQRINQEYGHLVGDRVLRFVAESIKKSVKGKDFVARLDGEKFAVILHETDQNGGLAVAKMILGNVASTKLTVSRGGDSIGSVTLSSGLSLFKTNETAEQFVARADACLQQAKAQGPNSIHSE